jgi:hypothetical protein
MIPLGECLHINLFDPYPICHQQPFSINVNNYGGRIVNYKGSALSNISKTRPDGVDFRGCTEPPGILIDLKGFHNKSMKDNNGGNIEAIITGLTIVDRGRFTIKNNKT